MNVFLFYNFNYYLATRVRENINLEAAQMPENSARCIHYE